MIADWLATGWRAPVSLTDRNSASVELVAVIDWVLQRYEITPSIPRMVNSLQGLAFVRQKRPFVCHALRVFANRLVADKCSLGR